MIIIDNGIKEFINYLTFNQFKSVNTIKAYKSDLKKYQTYLFNNDITLVEDITLDDIMEFINSYNYLKINSLARLSSTVKQFHQFLDYKYDLVDQSLNLNVTKDKNTLPKILSIADINILMNSFNDSISKDLLDHSILELIYSCGLRVSECCNVLINRLDLETDYLKVTGKGDKERIIPIPKKCSILLSKYIIDFRSQHLPLKNYPYLFVSTHSKKINTEYIEKMLRHRLLACNLNSEITPHKLRHSYASHLLQNGSDLRIIQELLGHSDIKTTEIYTHLKDDKIKADYLKFHGLANKDKK